MKLEAIAKRLAHHDRTCTVHVYSGDRHCSCGRDEALKELRLLRLLLVALLGKML